MTMTALQANVPAKDIKMQQESFFKFYEDTYWEHTYLLPHPPDAKAQKLTSAPVLRKHHVKTSGGLLFYVIFRSPKSGSH